MKKYLITFLSSFILELASTFYITTVSNKSPYMILFACLSPFLTLPFAGFIVETKTWIERIKLAVALSLGYGVGSLIVFIFIKN